MPYSRRSEKWTDRIRMFWATLLPPMIMAVIHYPEYCGCAWCKVTSFAFIGFGALAIYNSLKD